MKTDQNKEPSFFTKAGLFLVSGLVAGSAIAELGSFGARFLVRKSANVRKWLSIIEDTSLIAGRRVQNENPEIAAEDISKAVKEWKKIKKEVGDLACGPSKDQNLALHLVAKEDNILNLANKVEESRLVETGGALGAAAGTMAMYEWIRPKDTYFNHQERLLAEKKENKGDLMNGNDILNR